jgi:hypothetical protein
MNLRSAFTPQVIVNGRASGVGNLRDGLDGILREGGAGELMSVGVSIIDGEDRDGEMLVSVIPSPSLSQVYAGGGMHVSLVTYSPREINVPILTGENVGRTLPHVNVVKSISLLRVWRGKEEALFMVSKIAEGLEGAILVQDGRGGPVIAAAKLR